MKARPYLRFQAWAHLFVVIAFIAMGIFVKAIDEFGTVFLILMIIIFSYKSYSCFKQLKTVREEDNVYAPNDDASIADRIKFYKRILYTCVPAIFILSIWVYFDLQKLESGAVDTVQIWEPIALIYKLGGYWPAILTLPIVGILAVFSFGKKIKKLQEEQLG